MSSILIGICVEKTNLLGISIFILDIFGVFSLNISAFARLGKNCLLFAFKGL